MTLPMSVVLPSAGESVQGKAASRAFRVAAGTGESGGAFELALGAMITPATVRTPPAEAPVELVLDGEWRLDPEQANEESAASGASETSVDTAPVVDDGAVIPLSKSLENWLAVAGRRSAPVATEVRHGAAEEMVDLVGPDLSTGSPAAVEVSKSVGPSITAEVVRPAVDGTDETELPTASDQTRLTGSPTNGANLEDATVRERPSADKTDRRLDADLSSDSEFDLPADRTAVAPDSPDAAGVAVAGVWGAASPASVHQDSAVYRDRLLDGETIEDEPASAEFGSRPERAPARPVAANPGWSGEQRIGMEQFLDEGLDPEALLARYEARHPAVEIGGFAFPLDALDSVPEETAPAITGRSRAESAEVSAYDRLRNQVLAGQGEGLGGNRRDADAHSGRESGGKAAEHRALAATRGLEEFRIARQPGTPSEPVTISARREQADPVLLATPAAAQLPVESGTPEVTSGFRPAPGAATAADPTDRIARRVEHLMLNIADDQGEYGRLKVSVAGTSVRATILPNDPVLAERLTVDLRQLKQQLGDRGFADAAVTVQAPRVVENGASSPALVVRDVVETTGFEARMADRPRAEDQRRETPRDPRDQQREDQRPSHRSRDQRQDKRGGQG